MIACCSKKVCTYYEYALISDNDPDHGKLTEMLCVCTRALCIYKGVWSPILHVGGEILTREDRNLLSCQFHDHSDVLLLLLFSLSYTQERMTALMLASVGGHLGVVRELLKAQADVNAQDEVCSLQ